ncbi:MAG TPA: enoyl-CoA hydratase-related protein [Candidatus Polarisedimenticolaceae bacterium]|nr:enoyl-CoA hydratase-related protein [Candidatus Polarisedimenticolaceae bacterium]
MSGVRTASADGLFRITLDRPPVNVLSTAMMDAIAAALDEAAADRSVRVVRLDAAGKTFCAGVDVADHLGDKLPGMMDALLRLFAAFDAVPQPVLAVVQGAALGGGLELLLGCDLVLASEAATFGQPEIKLGVFAPPATVLLPRLIGERAAARLLLTGETLDARAAERLGLVHEVVPAVALGDAATLRLGSLLALSGAALRHAKRAIRESRGLAVSDAHARLHALYLGPLMSTEDAHEGLRSFMEKRPPAWKHR